MKTTLGLRGGSAAGVGETRARAAAAARTGRGGMAGGSGGGGGGGGGSSQGGGGGGRGPRRRRGLVGGSWRGFRRVGRASGPILPRRGRLTPVARWKFGTHPAASGATPRAASSRRTANRSGSFIRSRLIVARPVGVS